MAVHGKRSPAKGDGTRTEETPSEAATFKCPICDRGHARPYGLQSHFLTCATTNGNPGGYCWNENVELERGNADYKERAYTIRARDAAPFELFTWAEAAEYKRLQDKLYGKYKAKKPWWMDLAEGG